MRQRVSCGDGHVGVWVTQGWRGKGLDSGGGIDGKESPEEKRGVQTSPKGRTPSKGKTTVPKLSLLVSSHSGCRSTEVDERGLGYKFGQAPCFGTYGRVGVLQIEFLHLQLAPLLCVHLDSAVFAAGQSLNEFYPVVSPCLGPATVWLMEWTRSCVSSGRQLHVLHSSALFPVSSSCCSRWCCVPRSARSGSLLPLVEK